MSPGSVLVSYLRMDSVLQATDVEDEEMAESTAMAIAYYWAAVVQVGSSHSVVDIDIHMAAAEGTENEQAIDAMPVHLAVETNEEDPEDPVSRSWPSEERCRGCRLPWETSSPQGCSGARGRWILDTFLWQGGCASKTDHSKGWVVVVQWDSSASNS